MSDTNPVDETRGRQTAANTPRRQRAFWRKFLFALLLALLLAGGAFAYLLHFMHGWKNLSTVLSMSAKLVADKATHTPPFHGQRQVNILILGTDVDFGCSRTDTIKFVHLDLDAQRISVLSIPRDTWAQLPNGKFNRINEAYALGMADRDKSLISAKTAIEALLTDTYGQPVHADYYMRMQVDQFQQVVEALGGVDLNVEKQMDYEDPSQDLLIHLKPGFQHLDSYNTMCYIRFRHDNEGDYGRIRRQSQFLRALATKVHNSSNWDKMSSIPPILKMTYTNLEANDILGIKQVADAVGMDGMQMLTLPTTPTFKGAASVVEIQDPVAAAGAIRDVLNGPRVTVALVNGTKHFGLARQANDEVDVNQFNVLGTGTSRVLPASTHIFAPAQDNAQAQALATALGIPAVVDTVSPPPDVRFDNIAALSTPAQITVVLGDDFHPRAVTAALPPARRFQLSRHRGTISRITGGTEPIGVLATRPSDLKRPRHKKSTAPHGARPARVDGDRGLLRDSDRLVPGQ